MKQSVVAVASQRLGDGQSWTSRSPSLSERGDSPCSGPPLGSGDREEVRDADFMAVSLLLIFSCLSGNLLTMVLEVKLFTHSAEYLIECAAAQDETVCWKVQSMK